MRHDTILDGIGRRSTTVRRPSAVELVTTRNYRRSQPSDLRSLTTTNTVRSNKRRETRTVHPSRQSAQTSVGLPPCWCHQHLLRIRRSFRVLSRRFA